MTCSFIRQAGTANQYERYIKRKKKNRLQKVIDKNLSLYKNAACGSVPIFEVDYRMISPWHQGLGAGPLSVWGCHKRWTVVP